MSVNAAGTVPVKDAYTSYSAENVTAKQTESTAKEESAAKTTETADKKAENAGGVVYDKTEAAADKKATYSVNKMSADDRKALVQQLKADQENRQSQLMGIVQKMFSEQANSFANANDMWKFLAKGDYTVDAQTKLQAQQDISEDGYYGVKKTAERLFDFASALAGDDVDKMKEMQAAMEKGFKLATKAWGRELPDISKQTLEAANKKFEDYYASKQKSETVVE